MTLEQYLSEGARTPFAWGRRDCCLWVADWMVACGHADPAADIRGRYRTVIGAARILNKRGGVLGLFASKAAFAGLRATSSPQPGDVGVIAVPDPGGVAKPTGAICTGPRWATLAPFGLVVFPATPLAAWSV